MSEEHLRIKYRCQHPDCLIKSCRTGEIDIYESEFKELSSSCEDETLFKSPRGICRLGFPQTFKALEVRKLSEIADEESEEKEERVSALEDDPVAILKAEHQGMLRILDLIEDQILRRDINGLWITIAKVENEIVRHSIRKEEGVLFLLLEKIYPMSGMHIEIIKEDHRELLALLHSIRDAMREGDIPDNVLHSALSNLRSHIRKEDDEFFEMIDHYLDAETRKILLEGMEGAEKSHVVIEAGERKKLDQGEESPDQIRFKEALLTAKEHADKDHCH